MSTSGSGTANSGRNDVMVIVVAYGSEKQLASCLNSVGTDQPLVVIDNGSSDEAHRISVTAGATYIRSATNIGFAAAVNLALRDRDPQCDVLLLNPDACLLPADLTTMHTSLHRSRDLAAVGPRLVSPAGAPQKEPWPFPSPWTAVAGVVGAADHFTRLRFVSGAVLLLRSDAIDAIGLLDERFFLYAEEADWQLRAVRAGWRVGIVDEATAVHLGAGTSSDRSHREQLFNTSAELFIRKWYGALGWQLFRTASIMAALRRLVTARDGYERATQRRTIVHFFRGPVGYSDTTSDTQ
jgi:GT2 family glycosyltransferase